MNKTIHNQYTEEVRGEIIGEVSNRYSAHFKTVQTWPSHSYKKEWAAKPHGWWSDSLSRKEAVSEYIKSNTRETKLGDGTPCITTIVLVCSVCGGEHPAGCCPQDGKD